MAKKAGIKAQAQADRKRHREEAEGSQSESDSSDSEDEQQVQQFNRDDSSDESDDEDDDDDSSDDETENALFRPAVVKKEEEESSDLEEDSDAEDDEVKEEAVEEEEEPVKTAKKSSKKTKETTAASSTSVTKELEDEVARKTEATVYVEGIPYKADEGDIVSHFAPCGIVKEVRMPRYQDSGKPRGYAHVVFESASSIPKALKLDGKYLFGRYLTVKQAERPRTLEVALQEQKTVKKAIKGCKTVFVKHLPYDVEESTVRDALASCGSIVSVRLPLWNHTKKLKGFGYVEFSKEEEAVAAVKRSGMKIGDRMVIISLETAGSAPKASFRLADGRFWKKGDEAKSSLAVKLSEKQKKAEPSGHASKKQKTAK